MAETMMWFPFFWPAKTVPLIARLLASAPDDVNRRCEYDLAGFGTDQCGHLFPLIIYDFFDFMPHVINIGRITEMPVKIGQHCIKNRLLYRRGRRMIHIYPLHVNLL